MADQKLTPESVTREALRLFHQAASRRNATPEQYFEWLKVEWPVFDALPEDSPLRIPPPLDKEWYDAAEKRK